MTAPSAILRAALAAVPVVEIEAAHRIEQATQLPAFKGLAWHAVFGAALHDASPAAFAALLGPDQAQRPWVLSPPLDAATDFRGGEILRWRLRLFGPASLHADACAQALAAFGRRGLGQAQQRAALVDVVRRPVALDHLLHEEGTDASALHLRLLTPIAVRHDGRVHDTIPDMRMLVQRVLARIARVAAPQWQELFAPGERQLLLQRADAATCEHHALQWIAMPRRSQRQQRTMTMAGWQGPISFAAPAGELKPWFALARVLQLGSRTTFGFGVVDVS